jgi:hypothetical protein
MEKSIGYDEVLHGIIMIVCYVDGMRACTSSPPIRVFFLDFDSFSLLSDDG